jgi:hypothetical protein
MLQESHRNQLGKKVEKDVDKSLDVQKKRPKAGSKRRTSKCQKCSKEPAVEKNDMLSSADRDPGSVDTASNTNGMPYSTSIGVTNVYPAAARPFICTPDENAACKAIISCLITMAEMLKIRGKKKKKNNNNNVLSYMHIFLQENQIDFFSCRFINN